MSCTETSATPDLDEVEAGLAGLEGAKLCAGDVLGDHNEDLLYIY